jgi:hypothetical protein
VSVSEESSPIMVSVDRESGSDLEQLTAHERLIVGVVAELRANDETAPLAALVRDGGEALEHAREALEVLGELDPRLLVQVALDALVRAHVDDPGAAIDR